MTNRDEFAFWGRQIVEHADFAVQGLQIPAIKARAAASRAELGSAYQRGDLQAFLVALDKFMAFKHELLRTQNGSWIGWTFPSLLQHMLDEETFFLAKLRGPVDPAQEMQFWLSERMGENQVGAQLVDPSEPQAVSIMTQTGEKFRSLLAACQAACSQRVIQSASQEVLAMDQALAPMRPNAPKSLISPVLNTHIRREGMRMVQAVNRILGGSSRRGPLASQLGHAS